MCVVMMLLVGWSVTFASNVYEAFLIGNGSFEKVFQFFFPRFLCLSMQLLMAMKFTLMLDVLVICILVFFSVALTLNMELLMLMTYNSVSVFGSIHPFSIFYCYSHYTCIDRI